MRCSQRLPTCLALFTAASAGVFACTEAPTVDPEPTADAASACPAPTGDPVVHSGDVADGEIWRADQRHVVTGTVVVREGAHLTIEPCTAVEFEKNTHLQVAYPGTPTTGTLTATGTAKQPIVFRGKDGARWGHVLVYAPGTARLSHVRLEGGGGDSERGSMLLVNGDGEGGADPLLHASHLTLTGAHGVGALLQRGAAFVEGSSQLFIHGSGAEDADAPYPLVIDEHALATLPAGDYTGNRADEILLTTYGRGTGGQGLGENVTMRAHGVPYHVGWSKGATLDIGLGPDQDTVSTLTLEAGVVLKFERDGALRVQAFTSEAPASGVLRVLGSAERPVRFTSAAANPQPGDWRGIWYGGVPQASNTIEHARIEYAGAACGCILLTCSAIESHDGAIVLTGQPATAFVTHTTFAEIAGHAVTQGFDGWPLDFRETNTFEQVSGCVQTLPRSLDQSCPDPRPACDGV